MTIATAQYELAITQGATWYLPLGIKVSDGAGGESLLDTAGYTARFTVRDGGFDGAKMVDVTTASGGVVVGYSPVARAASTAYSVGTIVTPAATLNGFVYEATTGGTSGAGSVTWPLVAGATVTDGTVTWTAREQADRVTNVYVYLTAATTAALTDWGYGVYTLEITDTFGNVMRVLEGTCRLSREASY